MSFKDAWHEVYVNEMYSAYLKGVSTMARN